MREKAPVTNIYQSYGESLGQCRALYIRLARQGVRSFPHEINCDPSGFVAAMDELHRGLVVKVFIEMAGADRRWSVPEQELATILIQHVWGCELKGAALREAILRLQTHVHCLSWAALVRPFLQWPWFREGGVDLQSLVLRQANLVAKSDGTIATAEQEHLNLLHREMCTILGSQPAVAASPSRSQRGVSPQNRWPASATAADFAQPTSPLPTYPSTEPVLAEMVPDSEADPRQTLDRLIGMDAVKCEVGTLVNYIALQHQRAACGLPRTDLTLHTVFSGNPGTGKTTVARLLGQILRDMGVLAKGHLVETDRSGLVAEYAGQTAAKVNQRVDEALDGILFIDEAYGLVSGQAEDAYGNEAIQTLLKRMEDQRHRLVVILAGYPAEMQRLLDSNPGLSSRFTRRFHFDDYRPRELAEILESCCESNCYQLTPAARRLVLTGLCLMHEQRDQHFGNGRLARNLFEDAVRHLANRIVGVAPLTKQILSELQPNDFRIPGVAEGLLHERSASVQVAFVCPGCRVTRTVAHKWLGRKVRCQACRHQFFMQWGDPVWPDTSSVDDLENPSPTSVNRPVSTDPSARRNIEG